MTANDPSLEVLIKTEDSIKYFIKFEKDQDFEATATFDVFEVISWNSRTHTPIDMELYLKGYIKWDGCSHIYFGDGGYMHLCGKDSFEWLKKVMDAIWEVCSKKIKGFNHEIAS